MNTGNNLLSLDGIRKYCKCIVILLQTVKEKWMDNISEEISYKAQLGVEGRHAVSGTAEREQSLARRTVM